MRELRWASVSNGRYEVNGRPAGPRARAMLDRLTTTSDDNAVVEQWYRLSRIRTAYRAKQGRRRG